MDNLRRRGDERRPICSDTKLAYRSFHDKEIIRQTLNDNVLSVPEQTRLGKRARINFSDVFPRGPGRPVLSVIPRETYELSTERLVRERVLSISKCESVVVIVRIRENHHVL